MIEYRSRQNVINNDGYSEMLREASEYFAEQRVQMIGSGFDEIISEQSLFDTYVEKLSKGLTADEALQISQLLENQRMQIMQEATINGIQPYAALAMPTVRRLWVQVALKNALPTEVAKTPKFVLSYMQPYMFDSEGNKYDIPDTKVGAKDNLREFDNRLAERYPLSTDPIAVPTQQEDPDDPGGYVDGPYDLLTPIGATTARGDSIDPIFFIEYVTVKCLDAGGENEESVKVKVHASSELRGSFMVQVEAKHSDNTVTKDTLFANLDREAGTIVASSLKGKVQSIEVLGSLSSENNERAMSISFDIKTKDVTIGTGAHLNAPLPIEFLQDTMALYQIDGALEAVDLMSNVVAQKLDQEIREFLEDNFVQSGSPYSASFDIRPSASYAGSPKEWREELKTVIDYMAIKMKNDTAFQGGKYVLIGNPLDLNLITNVDWVFNSSTDERGGVTVDFNLGAYSGSQKYELVSSVNVPQGVIRMIYIPGTPKQMTYKYFPYTFNIEKGYIDPNRPNVPSVMMTKRHVLEYLTPLSAEITILHNTPAMLNELHRAGDA